MVQCAGGFLVYAEDRGRRDGPAVLLVHGFASNREVWDPVASVLQRTMRTIAVDLPGFGASSRLPGDYSPEALAAVLLEVLDALGVKTADVVAHSWGSAIALGLALRAPNRIGRLALIGAFVFDEQLPPFFRWAQAGGVGEALFTLFYKERPEERFPLAFAEPNRVPLAMADRIRVALERPGAVRAALQAVRGMRFRALETRLREVTQRTLLLWGREDRVSRLRFGERLANRLPAAELRILSGVGHFPPLERPHETATLLQSFLAEGGRR